MYLPLAILASFEFLYSIAAGRIGKTPFTGPIVFMSFGVLVGPLGLAWLNLEVTATEMRVLADFTLAMVLFCDAANADKSVLKSGTGIPTRMLLVGLPGVIALGYLCGWLIFDGLSLLELAILATALAATDAAAAEALVFRLPRPGQSGRHQQKGSGPDTRGPQYGERAERRALRAVSIAVYRPGQSWNL